jgi:hypothetical protein
MRFDRARRAISARWTEWSGRLAFAVSVLIVTALIFYRVIEFISEVVQ